MLIKILRYGHSVNLFDKATQLVDVEANKKCGAGRTGLNIDSRIMPCGDSETNRQPQSGALFLGGQERGAQLIDQVCDDAMA